MAQEMKEPGKKHCYACIQWDGTRSYYPEKKLIKVDVQSEGLCRVTRQKIKGSGHCDQFFPLR